MKKPTTCRGCQHHGTRDTPGMLYSGPFACYANTEAGRVLPDFSAFDKNNTPKPPEQWYPAPSWCPLKDESEKGQPSPFSNEIR